MAEKIQTTPASEWLVPNQDKLEQVIDARMALHNTAEVAEKADEKSEPKLTTAQAKAQADKEKEKVKASA